MRFISSNPAHLRNGGGSSLTDSTHDHTSPDRKNAVRLSYLPGNGVEAKRMAHAAHLGNLSVSPTRSNMKPGKALAQKIKTLVQPKITMGFEQKVTVTHGDIGATVL